MKRRVSIWFVMLASTAILVHSFLPHHHHAMAFVALLDVLGTEVNESPCHSHHEHETGHSEECMLAESALGAYRLVKDTNENLVPEISGLDLHLDLYRLIVNLFDRADEAEAVTEYAPRTFEINNRHIIESAGLRAPPFCQLLSLYGY